MFPFLLFKTFPRLGLRDNIKLAIVRNEIMEVHDLGDCTKHKIHANPGLD